MFWLTCSVAQKLSVPWGQFEAAPPGLMLRAGLPRLKVIQSGAAKRKWHLRLR